MVNTKFDPEVIGSVPNLDANFEETNQDFSSSGDFFEEWNEITPQIHIRKFEELAA